MYPPRPSLGKSWGILCLLCHNQKCWSTGLPAAVQLSVWLEFVWTLYCVNITFKLQNVPRVTLFMMWKWTFGQEILNCVFLKLLLLACSTFYHSCSTLPHRETPCCFQRLYYKPWETPIWTQKENEDNDGSSDVSRLIWCSSYWCHWWWNGGFNLECGGSG